MQVSPCVCLSLLYFRFECVLVITGICGCHTYFKRTSIRPCWGLFKPPTSKACWVAPSTGNRIRNQVGPLLCQMHLCTTPQPASEEVAFSILRDWRIGPFCAGGGVGVGSDCERSFLGGLPHPQKPPALSGGFAPMDNRPKARRK